MVESLNFTNYINVAMVSLTKTLKSRKKDVIILHVGLYSQRQTGHACVLSLNC